MAAEHDSIISLRSVERAANRIPHASTMVLPLGRFDIYTGQAFEGAVEMQASFLEEHLHAANAHSHSSGHGHAQRTVDGQHTTA